MTKTIGILVRGAALLAGAWLLSAGSTEAAIVTVTSTLDAAAADGACTLREAMQNVNAGTNVWADCAATGTGYGNSDEIRFNIGGGIGVKTIIPTTPFPPIAKPVTIDGYTQPGAVVGTNNATYPNILPVNATLMVEIDCGFLSNGATSALVVASGGGGTLIRGLSMGSFPGNTNTGALIELQAQGFVFGNFLGLRADGATYWNSASQYGVKVVSTAANSYIGTLGNTGTSGATRNVIAGCAAGVYGVAASGLVINGNIFGLDKGGIQIAPSLADRMGNAIILDSNGSWASYQPDIRFNVISGVTKNAVQLLGVDRPTVSQNVIGLSLAAVPTTIGNGQYGIYIANASPNLVAQNGSFFLNTIAGSGMDGISVEQGVNGSPTGNNLASNTIYQSAGLGINLRPQGELGSTVTPNDALDADSGPNGLQNFPVVTSAVVNGSGGVDIQFTLNSAPSSQPYSQFRVTAYANPSCNAKGHGEGMYPTGGFGVTVTTDASGNASGAITVTAGTTGWTAGSVVSLLAHDVFLNNTSEYSACMTIQGAVVTPTKLAFVQQPTNALAGAAISPAVTVQLQDAGGSPVSQAGVSVTVILASGTGTLSGTSTQSTNASGLATFAGLSVNLAGTKTLSASSTALTGATSSPFVISAGPGATLTVSAGDNQSAAVSTGFALPLQVLLVDGFGNPVSGQPISWSVPNTGASAAIAGSPATTDAAGHALVTATANGTVGSYHVLADFGRISTATFTLTNTAAPAQTSNVPALGLPGLALLALTLSAVGAILVRRSA